MFVAAWLADTYGECVAAVVAILRGLGVSPQRAADLAVEGVAEAHARAMRAEPAWDSQAHCRNWVVQVAVRYLADQYHAERRHRERLEQMHAEEAPQPSPLQPFVEGMQDALAQLPEEDRRFLERHYQDGLTLQELAEEFGLPNILAAWRRKQRILQRVRDIMQERGDVPPGW